MLLYIQCQLFSITSWENLLFLLFSLFSSSFPSFSSLTLYFLYFLYFFYRFYFFLSSSIILLCLFIAFTLFLTFSLLHFFYFFYLFYILYFFYFFYSGYTLLLSGHTLGTLWAHTIHHLGTLRDHSEAQRKLRENSTQRSLKDSEKTQRTLTSLAERTHVPRRAIAIFNSVDITDIQFRNRVNKLQLSFVMAPITSRTWQVVIIVCDEQEEDEKCYEGCTVEN